ncbi:MAG: hypothetical protein MK106_14475 [Mariniblastus sp.]|nr:hypothetical protein [Mariniblastus sp.]
MPKKNWLPVLNSMALVIIGLIAIYLCWRWVIDVGNAGPATLAPQNTFLVDPLYVRDDGSISYIRAINDWRSKGVTPDRNAFVDLSRALGPQYDLPSDWALAWAAAAGPDVAPPTGPFLGVVSLTTDEEFDQYDESLSRPWRDDEFPKLVKYLQTNKACLDLAVAASKKDQFYSPLIIPDEAGTSLIEALLPVVQGTRELVRSLKIRAMNHLAHGRNQDCLDDLIATRRLGHLVSQKGLLVEHLVGLAIVQMAIQSEIQAIDSGYLTKSEVEWYLAQLESLPEFNNLTDCVDRGERFCSLDMLQSIRYGDDQLEQITGWTGIQGPENLMSSSFDIDIAMAILNDFLNQQVEVTQAATFAEQMQRAGAFEESLSQLQASHNPFTIFIQTLFGGNQTRGRLMGNVMATLMLPAVSQLCQAETRRIGQERTAFLAFHLEHYRIENGDYPPSLDDLQLGNHPSLLDPYSGKPISYQQKKDGYQIHVVGANMQDDQGIGIINGERYDNGNLPGDDWGFEIGTRGAPTDEPQTEPSENR